MVKDALKSVLNHYGRIERKNFQEICLQPRSFNIHREKKTYMMSIRPTKTVHRIATLGFACIMFSGCSSCKEGMEKGFKNSYEQEFNKSCIESALKESKTTSSESQIRIRALCQCMSNYLVSDFDSIDLMTISSRPDAPKSQQVFEAAAQTCVKNSR